jgi:DNA polymerase (family 10)
MPIHNQEIAQQFEEIANLLELQNANPFRIRAYRNAARSLRDFPREASSLVDASEDLHQIAGVGIDLANKIEEVVKTGKMAFLAKQKKKVPETLTDLLQIPGLGPKRVQTLYKKLHIKTLPQLQQAIANHKISSLEGFGSKTETLIADGVTDRQVINERHIRAHVAPYAEDLVKYLKAISGVQQVQVCGSYRRWTETVGDLDFVVTAKKAESVMEKMTNYSQISRIVSQGPTRMTVILKQGIQVDVRVVPNKSYGAAVHYFTGSKAHVVALRKRAIERKLKVNEYGIFRGSKAIAGETEESVYKALGLEYVPPELRENRGEIEAAEKHHLPRFVEPSDLRGDLHSHTNATDGKNSLKEMAQAAKASGLEYLANTDHSKRLTMAHGFTAKDLLKRCEEIDQLNATLKDFTVLKGIEVDILEDGTLDLPDEALKELDIVVASVHSLFKLSEDKQTERIIRAISNPYVSILGHPTGRLIGRRESYAVNIEMVIKAVKDRGNYLELNANPERLDLNDVQCKRAKELGILISINSDAHSINGFSVLETGVHYAKRGWLEKKDILNTRSLSELKKLLAKSRK